MTDRAQAPGTADSQASVEISVPSSLNGSEQEHLRFTNALLSTQLEVSLDGILVVDGQGAVASYNRRFEELWAIPEDVLASRSDEKFLQAVLGKLCHPEEFLARIQYLYAQRAETSREEVDLLDGRTFDRYSAPMFGDDKTYYGRVWYFRDITDRKRTERELRFANALLSTQQEVSLDGILVVDENGKVLSFNARFVEIWSIPAEVVATRSDQKLLGAVMEKLSHPEEFISRVEYLYAHRDETSREEVAFRDGRTLDRYSAPMFGQDGTYYGRVWYFRDVTDRKQAEVALAQRTLELERSNQELEQFAYVASHDLQEPLRMVSSYTQLLAKRYKDQLDSDANDFIDFAVDGASRMQRLIGDLLTYSRIGTRGTPPAPVSAQAALEEALANLQMAIEENEAVVTSDELPRIDADSTQLVQVFQNLIANAIKFRGDQPPRIHVSAEQRNNEWVMSVKDNGIGIDPQFQPRLFQVFQRLHGRKVPGNGIGLALCRRIMERHGGSIWVESESGKGATFSFAFPC